jgi:adenosine deaminase CECR1
LISLISAYSLKRTSDASFRQNLSPIARRACAIVQRIRDEEKESIWTPQLEDSLAQEAEKITVYPGMMFSLSKDRMESTKLWKIVRQMPKGALLHAHMDAMVDFDYLFSVLLETPGMHITADRPLSGPAALENAVLKFRFFKTARTEGDIWADAYRPHTPILLTQAADAFPQGGRSEFLKWLYSRATISRTEAVEQHHGVDHVWRKFCKSFSLR